MGPKHKGKQGQNKKAKFDNKRKAKGNKQEQLKRKSETSEEGEGSHVKRKKESVIEKKESHMEVDDKAKENDTGGGLKRPHDDNDSEGNKQCFLCNVSIIKTNIILLYSNIY